MLNSMAIISATIPNPPEKQINVRADNFVYDEETDTLNVIDSAQLNKELEVHCTAKVKDRDKKLSQMKLRVLSQVKNIERSKRGRDSSVCSVRSVNSGVGVTRGRSESDDDKETSNKNPRLSSLLPTYKAK